MKIGIYHQVVEDSYARLTRCYGKESVLMLPDEVEGYPVRELAPYFFSAHMREEPGKEKTPCCGDMIEEIYLPAGLETMGRYAFYNCSNLKRLHLPSTIRDIGGGAFTGCHQIEYLDILVDENKRSCLKEVLSELTGTVYVDYEVKGSDEKARLVFPAFYEEAVENTPARLLSTRTHGCGHRYRYCFHDTVFQFKDYDQLFPYGKTEERVELLTDLCLGRLRYPYQLTQDAKKEYEAYLAKHWREAGEYLLEKDRISEFRWMVKEVKLEHTSGELEINEGLPLCAREGLYNIGQSALGETEFDILIDMATRLKKTWAVSFLMDEKHKLFPEKKKSFRLE